MRRTTASAILAAALLSAVPATASDGPLLVIENHEFLPKSIEVPAGKRVKVTITNRDASTEEFDSSDLHIEKMVPPGQTVSIFVGPLEPGTYSFVGELHKESARGSIVAK